jgi:flagellar biosynthesis chaperone FliJ
LNPIKLKKMQDRCQELEQQIEQVESEIAGYEAELANFVSAEESLRVSNLLEASRAALSKHLAEWEQVSQQVESQQA